MPRFILIDNNSGYIFGDSADFAAGNQSDLTPEEAAKMLDDSLDTSDGREYTLIGHNPRTTATGYLVYRADVNGSEAVPIAQDGQDREAIEAVERDCKFIGFVEISRTE